MNYKKTRPQARFLLPGLFAEQRQIGDLVKAALQGGEQGEAVLLQRRVVAHHHDVGEEGVQRRAEGRQLFQRGAVVAFL